MVIIFKSSISCIELFLSLMQDESLTFLLTYLFIQQVPPFTGVINFHIKIFLIFYTKIIIVLVIQTAKVYFSL